VRLSKTSNTGERTLHECRPISSCHRIFADARTERHGDQQQRPIRSAAAISRIAIVTPFSGQKICSRHPGRVTLRTMSVHR